MRGIRASVSGRILSTVLSVALLLSFSAAPVLATDQSATQAAPRSEFAPKITRELVDQRTETSRSFLMTDGTMKAEFYAEPIFYRDASSGRLLPIDASLETTVAGGHGVRRNKANSFVAELPDVLSDGWVRVRQGGVGISMRPASAGGPGAARLSDTALVARSRSATDVVYADTWDAADLAYESINGGLKETIVISEPTSASTFAFDARLDGLTARTEPDGSISLLDSHQTTELVIAKPCMWDSSGAPEGRDFSDKVSYEIVEGGDGYTLSVIADEEWLTSPDRIYPVMIDPTVITVTASGSACPDTWISSGSQGTNYSGATTMWVNDHYSGANYTGYILAQPGSALISSLATNMAAGNEVVSAEIRMTVYSDDGPRATVYGAMCSKASAVTISSVTWSNQPTVVGPMTSRETAADPNYSDFFDATDIIRSWQESATASTKTTVRFQTYTEGARVAYKSAENSGTKPMWTVVYAAKPTVELSSPTTETLTSTPTASWTYSNVNPQAAWELELRGEPGGSILATSGASTASTAAPVPEPSGGFVAGDTYYVRVKAASSPTSETPRLWSDWSEWGSFCRLDPVEDLSSQVTALDWFYEVDEDGDGVADVLNDTTSGGRGEVELDWTASPGADGYRVYLHDGNVFRLVDETSSTAWTSSGKQLYPTDSAIASMSAESTTNPFLQGSRDLRDDPNALYLKTAGTTLDDRHDYSFKVIPYHTTLGAIPASVCETLTVQLDNRTMSAYREPNPTVFDLGDMYGHDGQAVLSEGSLELDRVDLSIASWGPSAQLSRHYSSNTTACAGFSPGWTFNFDERLETAPAGMRHIDSNGDVRLHRLIDGAWVAPTGCFSLLSTTTTGYDLAHNDGSKTLFDSQGTLTAQVSVNGQQVGYEHGEDVTITAANGQRIVVDRDSSKKMLSASYATEDGNRTLSYDYSGGSLATVTVNPGTTDELPLKYSYVAGRLRFITGPYAPVMNRAPQWIINYAGGKLSDVMALPWPCYSHEFEYGSYEATVTSDRDGADFQLVSRIYEWNPDGSQSRVSEAESAGYYLDRIVPTFSHFTSTLYNDQGLVTSAMAADGGETSYLYDARGREVWTSDSMGAETSSVYTQDLMTEQTDTLGSTTYYTYEDGNPTIEEKVLNAAGERSRVERQYTSSGLLTVERTKIDTDTWSETHFSSFAPNGEPQVTENVGVKLSSASATQTLTSTKSFNAFGDLLWEQDATGRWVVKDNVYSISGRLLSSEVLTGTVEHYSYSEAGFLYETSTTAGSAVTNKRRQGTDSRGLCTGSVLLSADGSLESGSLRDIDPQGNVKREAPEGESVDFSGSNLFDERLTISEYDAEGRVSRTWAPSSRYAWQQPPTVSATRYAYDVEGRVVATILPGSDASQATTNTYDLSGRVTRTDAPDGTWTEYDYDPSGNVVVERHPTEGGVVEKTTQYDLAGRVVATTDEQYTTTNFTYDLAGRRQLARIGDTDPSLVTYNTLGWELSQTDPDGVSVSRSFDPAGRVLAESRAGKMTTSEYDAAGRLHETTDPDGLSTTTDYDAFGRVISRVQRDAASTEIARSDYEFDEHDRVVNSTETVGSKHKTVTYSGHSDKPSATSLMYGGASVVLGHHSATGLVANSTASIGSIEIDTSCSRDAQGRTTSLEIGGGSVPQGLSRGHSYDAQGHMVGQSGFGLGAAGAAYAYGSGRKTSETIDLTYPGRSVEATYSYHANGRLAGSVINGISTAFEFNGSGGLTTVTCDGTDTVLAYDGFGRLTSVDDTVFGWDVSHGWRTSSRRSGEESVTYSYSDAGRLSSYRDPNRAIEATYTYDADGQRNNSVVTEGGVTTEIAYIYDGLSLLSFEATRSDEVTYGVLYLYDGDDRPFAGIYSGSETTGSTPFFMVSTDRGDIVELLDSDGTAFASYAYDAWGNPIVERTLSRDTSAAPSGVNIADCQPLRYAGYIFDADSGHYYLSQRYYDSSTYQFLTKDPARANEEENAYQYCGGDPVGKVDPSGLSDTGHLKIHRMHGYFDWTVDQTVFHVNFYAYFICNATDCHDSSDGGCGGGDRELHSWINIKRINGPKQKIDLQTRWTDEEDSWHTLGTASNVSPGTKNTTYIDERTGIRYDEHRPVRARLRGRDGSSFRWKDLKTFRHPD